MLGDLATCLTSESLRTPFKFAASILTLPESLFSFFLSSQESFNESNSSFLEQKNQHFAKFGDFSSECAGKLKKIKKEAKENVHAIRVWVWKVFEKMLRTVFQLLARPDHRTTANCVKFLNICGGFFPFTQTQAEALISQLKPKIKDKGDSQESRECQKLCQSYNFFLLKKIDEEEFMKKDTWVNILGNTPSKKDKKREAKAEMSKPTPPPPMDYPEPRREKRKKAKKKNREKRATRKRERTPLYSPLNKRSDGEFKSNSVKSQDSQSFLKEKLQSKLRRFKETTRVSHKPSE